MTRDRLNGTNSASICSAEMKFYRAMRDHFTLIARSRASRTSLNVIIETAVFVLAETTAAAIDKTLARMCSSRSFRSLV